MEAFGASESAVTLNAVTRESFSNSGVQGNAESEQSALNADGRFVGTENLSLVLKDPAFRTALGHNARLLLAVPVLMALSVLIAILLFESVRGWRFHRAVVFLPYVLPIPVVGVVFGLLLTLNGPVNTALAPAPYSVFSAFTSSAAWGSGAKPDRPARSGSPIASNVRLPPARLRRNRTVEYTSPITVELECGCACTV